MKRKPPTMITLIIKKYRKRYFRKGEGKTLKIIKNNYTPSDVRAICPICDSIFEFNPTTECNGRTVICPCCYKSFIIEEKYIEIERVTYAIAIKKS